VVPSTLREIAQVVGGTLERVSDPDLVVSGPVVIDSRQVQPGCLFAAFVGEHVDGHSFAGQALAGGAVCVLASRAVDGPAIMVADTLAAVTALAGWMARRMTRVMRIGVTGSSGKTSTKDLLAQVLRGHGCTHATVGSRNNELGVPLTVLAAPPDVRYLVLEMGARGIGHLAYLTTLVPLDAALVLNVGAAHAGEFGGPAATAQAKGELVEALPADGIAVLNADDPLVTAMAQRTAAPVTWFGRGPHAHVRAGQVHLDEHGRAGFVLITPDGKAPVRLRLIGEHHVANALAAAALAHAVGQPLNATVSALSQAVPLSGGRMQRHDLGDGTTVIDDAYNANPDSVTAGLRALAAMSAGRPTVAVLGQMAELGDRAEADHQAIGALAAELGIDLVIAVGGRDAAAIADAAGHGGAHHRLVADPTAAAALLDEVLPAGAVVLVKASRSAGLHVVVEHLLQR
jgi:UDP-N-acetylmuramoyl-tripeptide--D-alanyl-D-alanine ligase